jgi:FMN-dependent NADH-azoreductase
MKNVLVINSSLNQEKGNSNKLSQKLIERLQRNGYSSVHERNLADTDLPHLTMEEMTAWGTAATARSVEQVKLAALSDTFIKEIQQADAIVIGMPMYNFGVPSTFKAWIDRVARAGITFKYTETGPQGLLANKKVYVLAARGGMYAGTPKDSQTQYLKDVFGFLGLTDVSFVYAEGLAMGAEAANKAWELAEQSIDRLSA